ncbi:MAG: hypothetical protein HY748_18345 [Elusimicrobia bacterium]|nr:hypothetical protein [Elusimicrobiota bacterium]
MKSYLDHGGDPAVFSPEEVYGAFSSAGREAELLAQSLPLPESHVIWIAAKLSREERHHEAVAFLSDDRWLFSSVPSDSACEAIIEVYRRAGDLHGFFNARCAGRPREFVMAIARALMRMDLKAGTTKTLPGPPPPPEVRFR